MILTITLNPSVDQTLYVNGLQSHDTNRVVKAEVDAGGKGVNLSRVAAELGAEVVATGFVGGRTGMMVLHVLSDEGVASDFVRIRPATRTVVSVESGDGPPTTFNGKGGRISKAAWHQLVKKVTLLAEKVDWVALGGSVPEGVPTDAYLQLARIARKAGAKVVIDADGEALKAAMEFGPDLIKPNSKEAGRLLGRTITSTSEAKEAALELSALIAGKGVPEATVILSRGAKGAVAAKQGIVKSYSALKIDIKSTVGCGDSMLAGFLVGNLRGQSLDQCMKLALAASAATAMTDGTSAGHKEDVERLLAGGK